VNASLDSRIHDAGVIASLFAGVGDDDEIDRLASLAGLGEAVEAGEGLLPALDVSRSVHGVASTGVIRLHPDDGMFEEFTDEEWRVVLEMRAICIDATRVVINKAKRRRAVEWLFVPGNRDGVVTRFDVCCQALCARPWVIRSLVHHLWYIRDLVVELPFLAVPLPDELEHEAILKGWEAGARLAHLAWSNPGVGFADLIQTVVAAGVPHEDVMASMDAMLKHGLLGQNGTRVYFTARPSRIRQTGGIGWSRSFV